MSLRVPVRVMLVSRGGVQDQRGESQFLWDLLVIVMNDQFVLRPPSRSVFYTAEIGVRQRGAFVGHAAIIELLVEQGVRFHSLYMDDDEEITEDTARAFMVHGPRILTADASLEFFDSASTKTLDGIFSLLLASESIHEVMIIGNMGIGTRRYWEWIFTAFFSTAVATEFHRLVLYNPAPPEEAFDVVAQGLFDARDVAAALFPSRRSSEADRRPTFVRASSFQLVRPAHRLGAASDRAHRVLLPRPLVDLRVLATERDWLVVLVPGWGRAWVHRGDVLEETTPSYPMTQSTDHLLPRLHHLVLCQHRGSSDELLALLRVGGGASSSLGITKNVGISETVSDATVRAILEACPCLVDLEVDVTGGDESDTSLASLSIFAACYEDGLCRATRLSLGANRIVEEARDFRLFQCLADKHHALYEHLEELQLTLPCVRGYETDLLPAVLTMLARNRRLQRFVICVTRVANNWQRVHSELRQSPVVAAIREHDGEPLPVRWKALPTRQKLAWLSVVQASAGTESMAAVHALDARVMGFIFEFAATCRTHRVCIGVANCRPISW